MTPGGSGGKGENMSPVVKEMAPGGRPTVMVTPACVLV